MIRKKKRIISKRTILYCLITLGLLTASLIKKDVDFSLFENRTMEYFHRPALDTILSTEWFQMFEKYNLDQVMGRETLVESNSRGLRLIGKRQINGITVCDNCTLLQASYDYPTAEVLNDKSIEDVIIPFNNAAASYGGQFYYMNIYPRYMFFWDEFPYHMDENKTDYLKSNSEDMEMLQDLGIRTVDTYKNMITHSDEYLFFHTDHHYTFRGAYYSYQALLAVINSNNPDRKPLAFPPIDTMEIIRPEGYFWGSLISQIGDRKYEGIDYLEYALPEDFPTEYERLESGEPSYFPLVRNDDMVEYGWFMNGDYGNTVIKTNRPDLPSILIIGYSFTDAMELMAVYNFNEMHSIDPRQFDGDITEYIKESKCDYVILQNMISLEN